MRKRFIYGSAAIVALSGLVVLGNSSDLVASFLQATREGQISEMLSPESGNKTQSLDSKNNTPPETIGSPTTEIPEHILYDRVFRQVVEFKKMAEEQQAKGEPVTAFYGYIEREAGLNEVQTADLLTIATVYLKEVEAVDEQAKAEIEKLRLEHQASNAPKKQLIQPSTELRNLQEQRDSLALRHRDRLKEILGNEKFSDVDAFVKSNLAATIKVLPVSTVNPAEEEK